ncbi:MAG: MFS transporter [Verrucomicrobia bacterium]|nr:MFS transporter [Verrucomicrobiota bacterium]
MTHARRWTIVGLLFVASLINYFDRATLSFALPMISDELHIGAARQGVLLSAFFWSYALMQIPVGWCADRVNLRWLYAAAFVIWSLAQSLIGLARSLTALISFRVLLGFGESIYLPGGSKIVSLLFRRAERGLPSGLFDAGTRTGLVIEGVLVPWMLSRFGWRVTFVVVGISALLWLIPWLIVTPRGLQAPANPENARPAGTRSCAASGGTECGGAAPGSVPFLARTRTLLTNRNLLGLCLGFFCFDYYWYLLLTWLPNYLVKVRHFSIFEAGLGASLPFLVFGASEPVGGWIADRLVRAGWNETFARKGVVGLGFMTGLFLIPAARVTNPGLVVALFVAASLVGISNGNQLVMLQGCAPIRDIGLWTGIYNFVGNVAGILAPIVTGLLVEWTGSYSPAFVLAAVMLVAGQLAYWFILGELKTPA